MKDKTHLNKKVLNLITNVK